jgi:hypothetical protein
MTSSPVNYSYMYYGTAAVVKKRNNALRPVLEEIRRVGGRPYTRGKKAEENIKAIARSTHPLFFHKDLRRVYGSVKILAEELKVPVIFAQEEIKIRSLGRTPEVLVPAELGLPLRDIFEECPQEEFPVDESDYPPVKENANGILRYTWRKTKQIIGVIFGGILSLIFLGIGLGFLFGSSYPLTSILFGFLAVAVFLVGVFLSQNHGRHTLEIGPEYIRYIREFPWKRVAVLPTDEVRLIFYNDFPEILFVGNNSKIMCPLQAMNPYLMYQEIRRYIAGYEVG